MSGAPAITQASVLHPLVDVVGDGFVASRSAAPVLGLTEGRMGLLVEAARASMRVLIVTPPHARLTLALTQYLQQLNGQWVVENADGALRMAATGRVISHLAAAFDTSAFDTSPDVAQISADFAAPVSGGVPWLQFTVSVHHAARDETLLGRSIDIIAQQLGGEPPSGWGTHEPAGIHWNRENVTRFVRGRMPRDTRLFVSGGTDVPFSATLHVFRSSIGVTEESKTLIALPGGRAAADAVIARVPEVLAEIAGSQQVLFAMAYEQHGAADATFSAVQAPPLTPLAAVVGARAIRDLAIDTAAFQESYGARRVGSPRVPSLVIPFDGDAPTRWERFAAGIGVIGVDGLQQALGLTPGASRAAEEVPRHAS